MSYPWQSLAPRSVPIGKLFESFYQIPPNQREFSWNTKDHMRRFWEDLQSCVREDFPISTSPKLGHFFGTIVVIGNDQSTAQQRYQVIDGQQRLTTLTIIARVLLEHVAIDHTDAGKKQSLTNKLLTVIYEDVMGTNEPRLRLNREDDFFQMSVVMLAEAQEREEYWASGVSISRPATRERLVQALRYFDEEISIFISSAGATGTAARNECIEHLVYALCDLFYVLILRVIDTRMAYRLFETLNERGMELSQADLVRNVVLEHAEPLGTESFDKALQSWVTFLDQIDNQEPRLLTAPELIQFSYGSRYSSVKAEKLFDEISSRLATSTLPAVQFAAELELDSMLWNDVLQGKLSYWNQQAQDSQSFIIHVRPIWKKHAVPLLLRIADRFDKKQKKLELGKALWATEAYLFREGTINSVPVSELEKTLGEAARIVGDSSKGDQEFVNFLKSKSPDAPFITNFETSTAKGKIAFYIAWRLENYVLGAGGFDMSKISPAKQSPAQHLEHIMPKKPDSSWGGIETNEEFPLFLDRIGNHLVLEGKVNSVLKNKSFSHKIGNSTNKDYTNQVLSLPKEVVSNQSVWCPSGNWDFESIKIRQSYLAHTYAANVWEIKW